MGDMSHKCVRCLYYFRGNSDTPCRSCDGVAMDYFEERESSKEEEKQMDNKQLKLAIVGQMGSGKDTIAQMIVREYEQRTNETMYPIAFAEGIRNLIAEYLPNMYADGIGRTKRFAMQYIGEALRTLDKDVWIKYALAQVGEDDSIIITDCRLQHEAEALREEGFKLIRIITDDSCRIKRLIERGNGNTTIEEFYHATEKEAPWITGHFHINNNSGTNLDDLGVQVRKLLTNLGIKEEDNSW